jgi:hypothetical protein
LAYRDEEHERERGDDGEPTRRDPLRVRLDALVARGAASFDPAEVRFVSSLLVRADRVCDAACEALRTRVAARLDSLEASLSAERAHAHASLDEAERAGHAADDLRAQLPSGDPITVALSAEARLLLGRLARATVDREDREVIAERAAPPLSSTRLAQMDALAAGLRLEVALARAASSARIAEGPYNAAAIAARLLASLHDVAPSYLRTLARDLDDLAAVHALTADAADPRASKPRRR